MSEQIDLKPCPFCGAMAEIHKYYPPFVRRKRVKVWCTNCRCNSGEYGRTDKAVEAWNRRKCKLTDDDIETIRIHISAFKEELSNQHRWKEAQEYDELINRLLSAKK